MAGVAAQAQKGTPVFSADLSLCAPHPIHEKSTVKCDMSGIPGGIGNNSILEKELVWS